MIAKKKSNLWNLHFIYSKTSKQHKYYSEKIKKKINNNFTKAIWDVGENTFMGPKWPEQETCKNFNKYNTT